MRLVATGGIVGIGVLLGAILVSQDVQGWIVGLVVALVSVLLSAVLWSASSEFEQLRPLRRGRDRLHQVADLLLALGVSPAFPGTRRRNEDARSE